MKQLFLVLLVAGVSVLLNQRLIKVSETRQVEFEQLGTPIDVIEGAFAGLSIDASKLVALGQLPAIVDWLWVVALLDPNLKHVPKGSHPRIYYQFQLITGLDPYFADVYLIGANWVSVIRDDGLGAKDLLQRGSEFYDGHSSSFPDWYRIQYWFQPWKLPFMLAYVYLYDLDDLPHASEQFKKIRNFGNAPAYLQHLAQQLREPEGEYVVADRLIEFMIQSEKEKEQLGTGQSSEILKNLFEKKRSLEVSRFLAWTNRKYAEDGSLGPDPASKDDLRSFFNKNKLSPVDPWGGKLFLDGGKIQTLTPHQKVFGV